MLLSKFMYFIHLHHICGINRQIGVSQGSMSQSRQGTPSVTATCLVSFFFLLILPAQPQDLVSYSFLLSSSSSSSSSSFFFFFFFLLATHLFHTLPYIWFWPNLLTVTGTLTTTHTLKMVGSGVTMGSLGSKRSFSPKTHQVLQIT